MEEGGENESRGHLLKLTDNLKAERCTDGWKRKSTDNRLYLCLLKEHCPQDVIISIGNRLYGKVNSNMSCIPLCVPQFHIL